MTPNVQEAKMCNGQLGMEGGGGGRLYLYIPLFHTRGGGQRYPLFKFEKKNPEKYFSDQLISSVTPKRKIFF